jgi:hypothetical protein
MRPLGAASGGGTALMLCRTPPPTPPGAPAGARGGGGALLHALPMPAPANTWWTIRVLWQFPARCVFCVWCGRGVCAEGRLAGGQLAGCGRTQA